MPLPATSERAARAVARVLSDLDDRVLSFLAGDGSLPSSRAVLADLRPLVTASVTAALTQVDSDVSAQVVNDAVRGQLRDLQRAITATLDDARRVKRRMPASPPEQDDNETVAGFVRRVGKYAALAAFVAARSRSGREAVMSASRSVGVRTPKRTAGYGRMLVRTQTAIDRNTHSADVVQRLQGDEPRAGTLPGEWAVFVQDARKGPTDRACEDVNGKWATPEWLRNHPVEHPNCLTPGQPVTGSADVLAAWSRPFDGEFVTIMTAAGREITVTPNHPILTSHGFHPAKSIKPGTEVVCYLGGERLGMSVPNNVERPPMIEDVVDALGKTGGVGSGRMPATPEQFYGDGTGNGDVDVVWTDRFLWSDVPELVKVASESRLITGQLSDVLFRECSGVQVGGGACHPSNGVMGGSGDRLATFGADALHVESFRVGSVAGLSPSTQPTTNGGAVTSEVAGDHVGRFPAFISSDDVGVDRVVRVEVSRRQTVVHDLSTSEGWFACSSIIVANCTRLGRPRRLPDGAAVTLLS